MTNLDCTDLKAFLSALIDDAIDADARHGAERHLAECADCRTLVDEVERADAALAEATAAATTDRLPDGFAPAVLARTVYAERLNRSGGGGGLGSWLGWIAAAACLALAILTWIVNHTPSPAQRTTTTPVLSVKGTYALGPQFRSWTHDGAPSDEAIAQLEAPAAAPSAAPAAGSAAPQALSPLDADTLESAAYMLQRLSRAQAGSFADLETVRRAAEYDDIVTRLAELHERLRPEDRNVVMAAEAVLFRLVNGPLDLADARALKESVAAMSIVQRLDDISGRRSASPAL